MKTGFPTRSDFFQAVKATGGYAVDGHTEPTEAALLDEHTASLDPKTALKVLELTDQIVQQNKLTT